MDSRLGSTAGTRLADEVFAGHGEMAWLMRSTDWSKTRLGALEAWPRSLRTMVPVLLGSRFPMLLWWGPELLHLYNDAYLPILRHKHPAALAAPAAEVWAEVWDVAGPMARSVQQGGPATWSEHLPLLINSRGSLEETFFTFSYSPVPGDDGGVGGVLNTVQETTAQVQDERELRMLQDLTARTAGARTAEEALKAAAAVLDGNDMDLPFANLYLLEPGSGEVRLTASSGWKGYAGPARPQALRFDARGGADPWPLSAAARIGREALVDDLPRLFGTLPGGRWGMPPRRAAVFALARAGQPTPQGFLVAGLSPVRRLDERYRRLLQATADRVATAAANARAYEEERRKAESLAELDRAKTAFFSNVSHEFRTPLTLILGPVEEALAAADGGLAGEGLQAVHRNAMRLLRLVNTLLDFSRLEAGRAEGAFEAVDLAKLTADLAGSFRSLVEGGGLRLSVDCPPLPEPVYVDVAQWEKVVLNLLSNAFKFTLEGEIGVRLSWRSGGAELAVSDTGAGIPEPELERIFERFHRVEGAAGRSFEGSGIGLALVRDLVRLHGGTVTAASRPGVGSVFTVRLPGGKAHLPPERLAAAPRGPRGDAARPYVLEASRWVLPGSAEPGTAAVKSAGGRAERVLVVDDNADMRAYLARILGARWDVAQADGGEAALAAARAEPPALVVSDVMMPGLDGRGLLAALRADPRTREVPVILVSARAGDEAVAEGLDGGADDYLVKPFAAAELVARVRTHIELARERRRWAAELEEKNRELEAFSAAAAHDLQAPLRKIAGFSQILAEDLGGRLDEGTRTALARIEANILRSQRLVENLLRLSRITRAGLRRRPVELATLAASAAHELSRADPRRRAEFVIASGVVAEGDPDLLQTLLETLLDNAWKFTGGRESARIEFGVDRTRPEPAYFVRDDGVGFDPAQAKDLFTPFRRLHSAAEFPGTGIGLTTARRIVERHGGRLWAEAAVGRGATFYFTLPVR